MKIYDFDLERKINIADTIYSLKDFDFYNKMTDSLLPLARQLLPLYESGKMRDRDIPSI